MKFSMLWVQLSMKWSFSLMNRSLSDLFIVIVSRENYFSFRKVPSKISENIPFQSLFSLFIWEHKSRRLFMLFFIFNDDFVSHHYSLLLRRLLYAICSVVTTLEWTAWLLTLARQVLLSWLHVFSFWRLFKLRLWFTLLDYLCYSSQHSIIWARDLSSSRARSLLDIQIAILLLSQDPRVWALWTSHFLL